MIFFEKSSLVQMMTILTTHARDFSRELGDIA